VAGKLRPDVLKIDRSFTSSVGIDSVNATVTDIIIALANRLNIVTVAEGVETLEQESYLRATASMCCRVLLCPADAGGGVPGVAGQQRGETE
jgi:sensor c-di-GMP phosphodiesterase-like protein